MAIYKVIASGNWSNLAIWQDNSTGSYVASTVLPGVNDDVYSNSFIVQMDQDVSVKSIRNQTATTIVEKGRFEVTTNRTITTIDGIFGAMTNFATTGAINACLYVKSPAITVNVYSQVTGGNGNYCYGVGVDQNCTLNVVGNCIGGVGSIAGAVANTSNSVTINITGNLSGTAGAGFYNNGGTAPVVNVTGNITAQGMISTNGGTYTVIGNVTGGGTNAMAMGAQICTIYITGTITAGTLSAIGNTNPSTQVIVTGNITNTLGVNALFVAKVYLQTLTTTIYKFTNFSGGANWLYPAGVAIGFPAESNVRSGTVFGPSSELTGTLVVPDPSNVRKGVATDATIGTAEITGEDILEAIQSSVNPIAERLRNVSTVQTTGDQIAGLSF